MLNFAGTMKCTPMRLYNRMDCSRSKFKTYLKKSLEEPGFYTDRYYGYSFSFVRKLLEAPRDCPKISVKTIDLPENFISYNTGCSLEKWSKKKPRLKSGKKYSSTNVEVLDENAYDISEILETLENADTSKENYNSLEVNSDIEELWRKSQCDGEQYGEIKQQNANKKHDKFCKKKMKQKLKKCIKYSFSKPPSPQTEQVIRVDISSTISVNELKQLEGARDGSTKSSSKLKNERQKINFEYDKQDFIVRCSQLAIETKQR